MFDEAEVFELSRTAPWDAAVSIPRRMPQRTESPALSSANDEVSHRNMAALSVLNLRLWEKAKWGGTMYFYYPGGEGPPTMALGFDDVEAAREIFSVWIDQFGKTDDANMIRITIVRGISRHHPSAYRILIAGNPEGDLAKGKAIQGHFGRFQTMDTPDGRNLNHFLDHYGKHNRYVLGFAKMFDLTNRVDEQVALEKRHLIIREAYSIGAEDIDSIGVLLEDDPIIPEGIANAPVLALLERKKSRGNV